LAHGSLRPGFTLVELTVVICLSYLLTTVIFSLYRFHSSRFLREEAYLRQYGDLKNAIQILTRDLKMAGNGLRVTTPILKTLQAYTPSRPYQKDGRTLIEVKDDWFQYPDSNKPGFGAIFGFDGGDEHADAVTVFKSELEYPLPLGYAVGLEGDKLFLGESLREGAVATDDVLAVVREGLGFLIELINYDNNVITIQSGDRFFSAPGPPGDFDLYGASVYNLKDVSLTTWYVDEENNRLMVAHHDRKRDAYDVELTKSAVMADNVEDLQLFYYYDFEEVNLDFVGDKPDVGSKRLADSSIKAAAVAAVGRSAYGDGPLSRRRPAVFNRNAGTIPDKRRRSTITELISMRNFFYP
jgi:type II secretory pathway pseudopilin PulG